MVIRPHGVLFILLLVLVPLVVVMSADIDATGSLLFGLALGVSGFAVGFLRRTWGPHSNQLTVVDLCVFGGSVYFGLGTIVSLSDYWLTGFWPLTYEMSALIDSLLLTGMALAAMQTMGYLLKRHWPTDWSERRAQVILGLPAAKLLLLLLPLIWIGRSFILLVLGFGMVGLKNEFWFGVSPGAFLAYGLTTIAGPGVMCLLALQLFRRRLPWLAATFMVLELAWLFLQGRRLLVIGLAAMLFVLLAIGWRPTKRHAIAALVSAATVFYVVWPLFFHMREIGQRTGTGYVDVPVVTLALEVAPEAWRRMTGASEGPSHSDNLKGRALAISFLVELVEAHADSPGGQFMSGRIVYRSILAVIPRLLWPEKVNVLGFTAPEAQIIDHFRLRESDKSSSWISFGYADGGVLGILVYCVLVALLAGFAEQLLRSRFWFFTPGAFLGYCTAGIQLMQAESPLESYIGAIRNMIVLMILGLLLRPLLSIGRQ